MLKEYKCSLAKVTFLLPINYKNFFRCLTDGTMEYCKCEEYSFALERFVLNAYDLEHAKQSALNYVAVKYLNKMLKESVPYYNKLEILSKGRLKELIFEQDLVKQIEQNLTIKEVY